ncbi:hypothetical protein [Georgenia sp. Z1491]|uniref:hypothetical protein n=1 Tax=Georgenia sp. Z1491 TaxID=3416707 RepID=UPI003CF1F6EC
MPIDTEVPGDPDVVLEVADWLKKAHEALVAASNGAALAVQQGSQGFFGDAGDAYNAWGSDLSDALSEANHRTDDAEGKVRTYNTKLRLLQSEMTTIRTGAVDDGLEVSGFLILEPDPAPGVAAWNPFNRNRTFGDYLREMEDHRLQQEKVDAYDDALTKVTREKEELLDWIDSDLGPALEAVQAQAGLDLLTGVTMTAGMEIGEAGLREAAERWDRRAEDWYQRSDEMPAKGNRRPRSRTWQYGNDNAGAAKWTKRIGKSVPFVGWGLTGYDLYTRDDDSTVMVESIPFIGWAAGPFYEKHVPEHIRTRADDLIDDVTDDIFDKAQKVWPFG